MNLACSSFLFFSGVASVIARALFLSISIPRWCTRKNKNPSPYLTPNAHLIEWVHFQSMLSHSIRSTVFLKSAKCCLSSGCRIQIDVELPICGLVHLIHPYHEKNTLSSFSFIIY